MTAVMVELTCKPEPVEDPADVVLVDKVEALLAEVLPGYGEDSPYN